MPQTWPATLPQYFLTGTYNEAPKNQFIRSDTDLGRPKVRRKFTAQIKTVSGVMRMDTTQIATLETFYYTTCIGGTDSFNLTNPFDLSVTEFYFVNLPQYKHVRGDLYDIVFSLEILP